MFKLDVGKKFTYLLYSQGKRDKITKCAKMELILNQIILILRILECMVERNTQWMGILWKNKLQRRNLFVRRILRNENKSFVDTNINLTFKIYKSDSFEYIYIYRFFFNKRVFIIYKLIQSTSLDIEKKKKNSIQK